MSKPGKTIVGRVADDVLEFTASQDIELDKVLVDADCVGTAAHVTMLSRLRLLPPLIREEERDAVVAALLGIMREARSGRFMITRKDQDVHLAVERMLTRRLGDLGRKVHTARSRNDQVAVDLRLYGKEQLLGVMSETAALSRGLLRFAKRHEDWPMVGRTHLQPAMPASVGLWASAHAESLLDDGVALRAALELTDRCPLGSAAGFGVALPIDRELTARLLGFRRIHHNVLYASNARGKWEAAVLSSLAQVMLTLSRLAQDLILYSMPEFGYFELPAEYCTGSSIMPQKKNPDVLELVRARASRVFGHASTVLAVTAGVPGGYSRDLQETKQPFLEGLAVTRACLRILKRVVGRIVARRAAIEKAFTPEVHATDRALELVQEGMSFREAYDRVKARLAELRTVEPAVALADKRHTGAATGLDFPGYEARVRGTTAWVRRERGRHDRAISRLLGVPYPALTE